MVNLLDFKTPSVTALERQGDEDAVVHWWTRPASRLQGLIVLEGGRNQSKAHLFHGLANMHEILINKRAASKVKKGKLTTKSKMHIFPVMNSSTG